MTRAIEAATLAPVQEGGLAQDLADLTDVYSGGVDDPAALYRELRAKGPVMEGDILALCGIPSTAGDHSKRQFYTLFDYADVMAVLRDPHTFTSGVLNEGLGFLFDGMMIIGMDGDEHRGARALLQPAFSPRSIQKWRESFIEPLIEEEFIVPMLPRGRCELLADFASGFPVRSVYAIIGLPDDPVAYGNFASWGLRMLAAPSSDPEKALKSRDAAMQASTAMYDHLRQVLAQRRAAGETEGDDLISSLFNADHEGQRLTDHEIAGFLRTVLPASAESTTRTFCNLMIQLLRNPAALAELRADRSLLSAAVEETVRLDPVVSVIAREVQKDVEFGGVKIAKGSIITVSTGAASRDEAAYERPDEFDLHRPRKPTLGWGFGPHMCIGMQVAKTEMEVAVNAMLDHMPRLRLDPDFPAPALKGLLLRGPSALHVRWD